MTLPTVAALYVDPRGVYANLPGVEVWDEARDARLYAGPWPVVAHPPCNTWAKLGRIETRGHDGGTFRAALASVREYGGVLEHPAESRAWRHHGLGRPSGPWWEAVICDYAADTDTWLRGEVWIAAVDQWHYGFRTRKPTWLYYVGPEPEPLTTSRVLATRGCDALWSTERARTPSAFRDVLLSMARQLPQGVAAE